MGEAQISADSIIRFQASTTGGEVLSTPAGCANCFTQPRKPVKNWNSSRTGDWRRSGSQPGKAQTAGLYYLAACGYIAWLGHDFHRANTDGERQLREVADCRGGFTSPLWGDGRLF
jgi:hypothetical protein